MLEAFHLIAAGPLSTFQDAGRPGLRRYGIPPSGAMDLWAYRLANLLVGNRAGAAVVEVTLQGWLAEAVGDVTVAVTGGDLGLHVNDQPAPMWTALALHPGDRLELRQCVAGCRAYVAVRGGFAAPEFLGSRSTFLKGRMGAPLRDGDALSLEERCPPLTVPRVLPLALRPQPASPCVIRVILGPQTARFTACGLDTFLGSTYTMSPRSDRQGIGTEGPIIETIQGSDIISDPTPLGAIQVPGDGRPIILHRDGQVTGGYAKIATAISIDLDRLAQLTPGVELRFQSVSRDEALALSRQAQEHAAAVEKLFPKEP